MTVVNFPEREIQYYDSLSGDGKKYKDILLKWLACELMFRKSEELDIKHWEIIPKEPHMPQQTGNGTECRVFSMMCADFTHDNLPLVYSLGDVKFFRNKISADILRNAVYHSFLG
jgi:Ulp1 family protease